MTKPFWKQLDPELYFKNIEIPDNWDSIEEFVEWYLESKMPIMIPWDANIIKTDDATAVCIFKKPPYMIELYLIHQGEFIRQHCHPGMEVITMQLGGGSFSPKTSVNVSKRWGDIDTKLMSGDYHGSEQIMSLSNGFSVLAFSKWDNAEIMTSAAIQWKGKTAGPMHDELIKKHYPDAYVKDGVADITKINTALLGD